MKTLKAWMSERLETPEKAHATLSNIAMGGAVIGFLLTLMAVLTAN